VLLLCSGLLQYVSLATSSPIDRRVGAGGGTIATQWLERSITVWFFQRGQEPADLNGEHPQPETWGVPHAAFPLEANCASTHFEDLQLVFDTTFCGGFAGGNAYSETCHDAPLPCRDALVGDAIAGEHDRLRTAALAALRSRTEWRCVCRDRRRSVLRQRGEAAQAAVAGRGRAERVRRLPVQPELRR